MMLTMKLISVPLSDDVAARLRDSALANLRQPRMEARHILEAALGDRYRAERTAVRDPEPAAELSRSVRDD
jgi:hypothetical protein